MLNSFQMASLLVQAYPAVPDALAVASAVIADMNEKGQPLPSGLANMQGTQGLAGALWRCYCWSLLVCFCLLRLVCVHPSAKKI